MYANGFGVTKDYAQALEWLRKAAEQGNASGQQHLGWMYLNGLGVAKDDTQALKWLRKAADQGDVEAKKNVEWLNNNIGTEEYRLFEKAHRQMKELKQQENKKAK